MVICVILGMSEKARMKVGILVAAWNIGGYCLMSRSVISQVPYFGSLLFKVSIWGM